MVSSKGATSMPCALQHEPVVLEVLADLEDGRVLEQRLQQRRARRATGIWPGTRPRRRTGRHRPRCCERHVAGPPGRERQREADEVGLHRHRARRSRCRWRRRPARAPAAIQSSSALERRDGLVGVACRTASRRASAARLARERGRRAEAVRRRRRRPSGRPARRRDRRRSPVGAVSPPKAARRRSAAADASDRLAAGQQARVGLDRAGSTP